MRTSIALLLFLTQAVAGPLRVELSLRADHRARCEASEGGVIRVTVRRVTLFMHRQMAKW